MAASGRFHGILLLVLALLAVTLPAHAQDGPRNPPSALGDLPLEIHTIARPTGTLMLLLSGDTGWGDLEEAVTDRLNQGGISVVGLDSHRYFFSGKSPARLARDLERILVFYTGHGHPRRIVLAGYSFGADALPFAWPRLSAETRYKTSLIALIGFLPAANFQISFWEMLSLPASDDTPVGPAAKTLPMKKVMCIYGVDDDTACTVPQLKQAARIKRPGGHGFDGDYAGVADVILGRLRRPRNCAGC